MSATLGALVIAISTEFSVLLAARYRAGARRGLRARGRARAHLPSTGAAVLASGTTAIAGFAVLVVSDIRMLRDFGVVTVVDLTVSLLGVMVVLPAVLVLAERGEPVRRAAAAARAGRAAARAPRGAAAADRRGRGRPPPRAPPAGAAPPGASALRLARRRHGRRSCVAYVRSTRCGPTGPASRGVRAGTPLPPFAVPLAIGAARRRRQRRRAARPGRGGDRPACAVRGAERAQLVRSWPSAGRSCSRSSSPRGARAPTSSTCWSACARARPGRAVRRGRRSGGTAAKLRELVRAPAGRFPVGYDHDGVARQPLRRRRSARR